jgi:hypothetical protein
VHIVNDILPSYKAIDLAQLDAVDFEKRLDTKFTFHNSHVRSFLKEMQDHALVLEVKDQRLIHYDNRYLDTEEHTMYLNHHNGRLNRYKVRIRHYGNGPTFAEVKFKSNKKMTRKWRTPAESLDSYRQPEILSFINRRLPFEAETLVPAIDLSYQRITMASNDMLEKFTLDFNLTAQWNGKIVQFADMAIAEIKQRKLNVKSPFYRALMDRHIYPTSFSKYCVCMASMHGELKQNRFKPILRNVNKLTHGAS